MDGWWWCRSGPPPLVMMAELQIRPAAVFSLEVNSMKGKMCATYFLDIQAETSSSSSFSVAISAPHPLIVVSGSNARSRMRGWVGGSMKGSKCVSGVSGGGWQVKLFIVSIIVLSFLPTETFVGNVSYPPVGPSLLCLNSRPVLCELLFTVCR